MLSSGDQTKRPAPQNLLWNIIYNFGFKFQPVDQIFFCKSKEQFFYAVYTKN